MGNLSLFEFIGASLRQLYHVSLPTGRNALLSIGGFFPENSFGLAAALLNKSDFG